MIREQLQEAELMLYEDDVAAAMLAKNAASKGHIVIIPKKEVKSIEDFSEEELEHIFYMASYSATLLFEAIGAQGTNILVTEGEDLRIDIIARRAEDGLNFQWKPKQVLQGEMDSAKSAIAGNIILGEEKTEAKEEPNNPPKIKEQGADKEESPDEDYRIKQLYRIP